MKDRFPQFEMFKAFSGTILCTGWLQTNSGMRYKITVEYPADYPNSAPLVYPDDLPDTGIPHTFSDGRMCLYDPSEAAYSGLHKYVPFDTTIADIIAWAAKWLAAYEEWRQTGSWPGPAR